MACLWAVCVTLAFSGGVMADQPLPGGLVVQLGAEDVWGLLAATGGPGRVMHILNRDRDEVRALRRTIRAADLYGRVSVDTLSGDSLPYADGTVRLLIVRSPLGIDEAEMRRVLCPQGTARIAEGDAWREIVKPRPAGMDEWTHGEYDASNHTVSSDRLVGPPRSTQWIGSPKWTRTHEAMSSFNVMVSAGGRVFYIVDEGSAAAIETPADWKLCARDAFSGVTLWKRRIPKWLTHYWPWKCGPSNMVRRLVAVGDEVFVPRAIDQDVAALDAATGEVLRKFADTAAAEELLVCDGTLVVATAPNMDSPEAIDRRYLGLRRSNTRWDSVTGKMKTDAEGRRRILAFDTADGRELWRTDTPLMHMALAAKDGKVVYHNGSELVCASVATGEVLWKSSTPHNKGPFFAEVTPTLALHEDLAFYTWDGTLSVHSMEDGRQLWTSDFSKYDYRSPPSCYVVNGLLWRMNITRSRQKSEMIGYDPRTGKEKVRFQRPRAFGLNHHRCHKTKATERFFLTGMFGVEFVDPVEQTYVDHNWVRGACLYGFMPANGLLYIPPHSCACNVEEKVNGFMALSPRKLAPHRQAEPVTIRGSAFGKVPAVGEVSAGHWPMYRAGPARSASVRMVLPTKLTESFTVDLQAPSTPPVVAGGVALVAQPDDLRVVCLSAADGSRRWAVTTPSRVDSPPTISAGRAIFGCADGWIYCLRLTDGELVWKTCIAPQRRWIVVRDRLESTWPVNGSLIVRDGVVYAVAGRSTYTDGGMVLARLDAESGQVLSRTSLTGEKLTPDDRPLGNSYGHGSLRDLLVCVGDELFMRNLSFNAAGELKRSDTPHIYAAGGFLDTHWHYRHYWSYGPWKHQTQVGYRNWHSFGEQVPSGRILAFDNKHVFGFGRDRFPGRNAHQFVTGESYKLFRAPQRGRGRKGKTHDWLTDTPFHGYALVLAQVAGNEGPRDVVVMAGPEGDTLHSLDAVQGRTEGKLLLADRENGEILSTRSFGPAGPVIDGMAAADGKLYIVTTDHKLLCLGAAD
jgi:outer membrane protein assembly factor BamB